VSLAPSPRAALASASGWATSSGRRSTRPSSRRPRSATASRSARRFSDEETSAYVEELEQRAELLEDEEDLPSGESLAAELTRFLRERERGNGGPERGPSSSPSSRT
jgi:hypothetical protein